MFCCHKSSADDLHGDHFGPRHLRRKLELKPNVFPRLKTETLPCEATELVGLAAGLISTSKWPPDLCVSLYPSVSKPTSIIFVLPIPSTLLVSFLSRISECQVSVTAVGGVVEQLPRASQSFLSVIRLNLWQASSWPCLLPNLPAQTHFKLCSAVADFALKVGYANIWPNGTVLEKEGLSVSRFVFALAQ